MTTIEHLPYKVIRQHLTVLSTAGQMGIVALYADRKRKSDTLLASVIALQEFTKIRGAKKLNMIVWCAAWFTYIEEMLPLLIADNHVKLATDMQALLMECAWVRDVRDKALEVAKNA